ncbi:MAG: hypothetical protein A2Y07_10065 [Planctomycetes bacterium GWF2_50_10]|nr:MAG: hypothetical protein A2Y07_10065 [Planctomycetes bacterium GWF2_50_10]
MRSHFGKAKEMTRRFAKILFWYYTERACFLPAAITAYIHCAAVRKMCNAYAQALAEKYRRQALKRRNHTQPQTTADNPNSS